jgi:hypothetical protein
MLFVLAVDPLVRLLNNSPGCREVIDAPSGSRPYSWYGWMGSRHYADDTAVIARSPRELADQLAMVKRFGEFSGLRLNLDKCVMVASRDPDRSWTAVAPEASWTTASSRYLGIWVGYEEGRALSDMFGRLRSSLSQWDVINVGLAGRIAVLNAYVAPTLRCGIPGPGLVPAASGEAVPRLPLRLGAGRAARAGQA